MLSPLANPFRKRRGRSRPKRSAPSPAGPALVLSATVGVDGVNVTLVFDRPLALTGPIPYEMDGSVVIGEASVVGVTQGPADTLVFDLEGTVEHGMAWSILFQPGWLATAVEVPQSGDL